VVRGEREWKAAGECAGEEDAVKEEDMDVPLPSSESSDRRKNIQAI
jgi:hypothetical protein